jgi:hypothetical protein
MIAGLTCIVCRADFRAAPEMAAMVVAHHDDQQLLACAGICARIASGSIKGLDETASPLTERVQRHADEAALAPAQAPPQTPAERAAEAAR